MIPKDKKINSTLLSVCVQACLCACTVKLANRICIAFTNGVTKQLVFRFHAGKCIRRFGGIYAYFRYFIDRNW